MITRIFKFGLAGKLSPFVFRAARDFLPDYTMDNYGIYLHIPFCKQLCAFCPYYKVVYNESLAGQFAKALEKEIVMAASRLGENKRISSVYLGGGSSALLISDLPSIFDRIREHFHLSGGTGIELHPRDVNRDTLTSLQKAGVTMLSLGVQSFRRQQLSCLGRLDIDPLQALKLAAQYDFSALDVDLIFGIPGQGIDDLESDFSTAVRHGATQISTYPFIAFSYSGQSPRPAGHRLKKKMLGRLIETADRMGFERTSVWTFGKKNRPCYSSITRENFLGFGPSATSLSMGDFKINTFSVEAYIESVEQGVLPSALRLEFDRKTRAMYWLFWSCYNGTISSADYERMFQRDFGKDYGRFLSVGRLLGCLKRHESQSKDWLITRRGSHWFHRIEQAYTHQYIDKAWCQAQLRPWPEKIELN